MKAWTTRELLAYLDRVEPNLSKLNHFELLDVDAISSEGIIQDAFHQMATRMHPDRHRKQLSPRDHERLTIVYARIAEAYRVLRDEELRTNYLVKIASNKGAEKKPAEASEDESLSMLGAKTQRLYRRAQTALRTGDRKSAVLNLRMALAKHPSSSFLKNALREAESGDG